MPKFCKSCGKKDGCPYDPYGRPNNNPGECSLFTVKERDGRQVEGDPGEQRTSVNKVRTVRADLLPAELR